MTTREIIDQIAALKENGQLPMRLTSDTVDEMAKSMDRYFKGVAQDKINEFANKAKELAEKALSNIETVVPGVEGTVERAQEALLPDRLLLADFIEQHGEENVQETMNMELFFRVPREVAYGAGNFVRQNADEESLDEYPALELTRVFDRAVPRGSTGQDGDDPWPVRWEAAGGKLIDGRMVALKSDPVWQALGDGVGGYDDTLGNPFPPFAFNSGYEVNEVTRTEAEELGLLQEGQPAEPAQFDFSKLFVT